ncbi:MAG TPA: YiiX/YebB-like N1pC/P60 family cysteine hydrolase [Lacipirellula sp.]
MSPEQLTAAAITVVQLDQYLQELKTQALAIYKPEVVSARGYITPSQETLIRQLQLSYWKTRLALLELVNDLRAEADRLEHATPQQFLIGLAAASLLVDAARWLRTSFHRVAVVRRKLDEPDPVYNIPPRMYDCVQRSLVSINNAWHLWQAARYYDRHRMQLAEAAVAAGFEPLVEIIDRLRERLRPSPWLWLRTRVRVRGRRATRRICRDILGRAVYSLQQAVSERMAELSVSPGHQPGLPPIIREQVLSLLRPGDVLVVRKEYAATNYFLPGYWPHAALVLGTPTQVQHLPQASTRFSDAEHQSTASTLSADLQNSPLLVLESMKDGVRIRSIDSPLASDSVVVLRPKLDAQQIEQALAQALLHEGKPYDFDFDFTCSHRMVCTEVVYRAYDGVASVSFNLNRHVGRYALAAGDLLRMGLAGQHFEVAAVYCPAHGAKLLVEHDACELIRQKEGQAAP